MKKHQPKCPHIETFPPQLDFSLVLPPPFPKIQIATLTFDSLSIWPNQKGKVRKWSSISIKKMRETQKDIVF